MNSFNFQKSVIALCVAGLVIPSAADARRKRKKKSEPIPVGWYQAEGWGHACYNLPDFSTMNETERRIKSAELLDEAINQWAGRQDEVISFSEEDVDDAEVVLLGRPKKIEGVLKENFEQCSNAAKSGDTSSWKSWFKAMPNRLTEGECKSRPFDYTMFDYLEIGTGWQRTMPICAGDKVRVTGTAKDRFRIAEDGPWITVLGNLEASTAGSENHPCNIDGCFEGQLIMKFKDEAGVEVVIPVGVEHVFSAHVHGEISYRINDTTYFDNEWYQSGGLIEHTGIEISPVD